MKNKSTRHKSDNIFKFQPFSERISNIDVDIFHHVGHEYETLDEDLNECYFYAAIEKWNVLNLTESYALFKKEVKSYSIVTLPQLIHSKDVVIESLLKHLRNGNVLSLQPLLELVVALAKDLQNDFYQYYPEFFETLLILLKTNDSEKLEWTFQCLAYLFKFLWRSIVKDIQNVFKKLLPLLSYQNPAYIKNFAAESFAFVARKVKNRNGFLELILKGVKQNNDSISGCGKLLFEVLKGVPGQLHSCAETLFPFLLESLQNDNLPQKELFEILEKIIENLVEKIHPNKSGLIWDTYYNCLDMLTDKFTPDKNIYINQLITLIGETLEYKEGRFLDNPSKLIEQLIKILNLKGIDDEVKSNGVKVGTVLMLSKNVKLSQEQACKITNKILSIEDKDTLLYFTENTFKYASFEALILPTFLKYCIKNAFEDECLKVFTKMILYKVPFCQNGIELEKWKKYTISLGQNNIESTFLQIINAPINYEDIGKHVSGLICLPHLNVDLNVFKNILSTQFENICNNFDEVDNCHDKLFLIYNLLLSLILSFDDYLPNIEIIMERILPLCKNSQNIIALNIVDLYFTILKKRNENLLEVDLLKKIHTILGDNFTSPYHKVRLLTTHIYSLFEMSYNFSEDWNIFSICYNVESMNPQVDTYREQLKHLEKFNFDKSGIQLCISTDFKIIPLQYLCGVLYMNFKLLWDPIIDLIESHAHGLEVNVFWEFFHEQLLIALENSRNPPPLSFGLFATSYTFIGDLYQDVSLISDKPDFYNYRLLLWRTMKKLPDIAEIKTRDVTTLFLNFIENEYMKSNSDVAYSWNIKENTKDILNETMEVDIDVNEIDEDTKIKQELSRPVVKTGSKMNLNFLLEKLSVLSKIKNPRAMYKQPELYKLYFDFLSHKNPDVQKTAFQCIMAYKFKYLTPYKENLQNLIDDKNFKNEIVTFRVDKETSIVLPDHRENLLPIVLQIIFSKMVVKTGLRTGGKSSGQWRRNLILRFLAGCNENETLSFVKMVFKFYLKFLDENDVDKMANNIVTNVNLEMFVPPKRLQSSTNLLKVILEQFGNLMGDELLKFLLKVILCIGAHLIGAFNQYDKVHAGYLPILKNIKTACIKLLERFFLHFESYEWSTSEINAIFNIFIWPYVEKLQFDSIHSPTALLKLICLWGTVPQYFPLLVKHKNDNTETFVLKEMIYLLLNKSHITIYNSIMETIEKLLTLTSGEADKVYKIDNVLPIKKEILERLKISDKLNYGSCILLPHVPFILEKFKLKLSGKTRNLNRTELLILSRISELVWEAEISDSVLDLLLPIILRKCNLGASDDVVLQYIMTVSNLIKNVDDPKKHLRKITPLVGYVNYIPARKLLFNILKVISPEIGSFISELNAYDAKWVDQPDFQVRLDVFKKIDNSCENSTLNLETGVLIIYNCYYSLSSENDLSLRVRSTNCLKTLCPYLIKRDTNTSKDISYLLDETLLAMIKKSFRHKKRDVRQEAISLLGHLARECSDYHIVLKDLNKVTDKVDLEVDFFENLNHLQLHRHGRAFLKFSRVYKNEKVAPNIRTLTQYFLPLTSYYLCNDSFLPKHTLIDSAVEAIGTISKLLPWHHYESLLKYYLTKLKYKVEYQKQIVKIIVAILDAFHFDLSKGHVQEINKKILEDSLVESKENVIAVENNEINNKENLNEEEDIDGAEKDDIENIFESTEVVIEEEESNETEEIPLFDKTTILCKSSATRVTKIIQVILLPQLHRALAEMTQHEASHKINRKRSIEREDADLLRVPISLAVVKLLQKLPKAILDLNLPGVFMKICTFLKSQMESVRRAARETLIKIMLTLGPDYLGVLLAEITTLLSKGFQIHVLVYTIHSILNSLKDKLKVNDIDKVLLSIIEVCQTDLFGALSDEREIQKIVTKTTEAKTTKSNHTFQILAQFITDKCLMDLVLPIKHVLGSSYSHKVVIKAQECLRCIAEGLVDNKFIEAESLLKFAYGIASESIPQLLNKEKVQLTEKEKIIKQRLNPDCFIIAPEPKTKFGVKTSMSKKGKNVNAHILIEFGLRLCNILLKRDKLKEMDYRPFIDPFVEVFKNCLLSQHVKLCTISLQCLQWILKLDLPSMKGNVKNITESLFAILHKYAASGLSKGDNFDLVVAVFKTMSVIVKDVTYHIQTDQLKILLLYVEQDLYNYDRQAVAFELLRAIIGRKLIIAEVDPIMTKVAELNITSESFHVRVKSREVLHNYLMHYPLGKKLDKHISFYLAQISYDVQSGRESALEMLQKFIHSFPPEILKEYSGRFFIEIGARLINEEVPLCRKMAADCINSLLTKLETPQTDTLFDTIILWLKDKKLNHKRLAAQLCGIVIAVEKEKFDSRLPELFPVILLQFGSDSNENKPGKFVLNNQPDENDDDDQIKDHHLYQVLQMILKLCIYSPTFLKRTNEIENLAVHIQMLLAYPHDWVRLSAAQIIGYMFTTIDIGRISNLINNDEKEEGFIYSDPLPTLKSLTLDLCAQLQPGDIKSDLAEQVIKNLIFIARALEKVHKKEEHKISLLWLIKNMRKIINSEVITDANITILRTEVFKWMAGVITVLDFSVIQPIIYHFMSPLVREMISTEESNAPLRQLAKEVAGLIKRKVGIEVYTDLLSKSQQLLSLKRAERKRTRKQMAVSDPEMFAKKKIKLNQKKKESKRRTSKSHPSGKKVFKKRRIVQEEDFA